MRKMPLRKVGNDGGTELRRDGETEGRRDGNMEIRNFGGTLKP